MTTILLPPMPVVLPALVVDPAGVRECSGQLLAASAQVDDLGTFAAGDARLPGWTGDAGSAYHAEVAPLGERADAMSLALRAVGRRVDQHATALEALRERRTDLDERRRHLAMQVRLLREQAATPPVDQAGVDRLAEDCERVGRAVRTWEEDAATWAADVAAEEQVMVAAFEAAMTAEQVEKAWGAAVDPADVAWSTIPPAGSSAERVHDWWESLTREQQLALVVASPGAIGNRDGIPAADRHAANTVALDRDLADGALLEERGVLTDEERQVLENARAADRARAAIGGRTDPVTGEPITPQLYLYDPRAFDGDGAVAIAAGDLDTADNVALVVPGFGTDGQSAPYQADRAATMYESSRYLDPSQTNATMFWIGYDAPDNLPWTGEGWDGAGVVTEGAAEEGGERLADTVDGLRATREDDPAHLTTVGHSYGSTTAGHAAEGHDLDTDDLVFVGSPGVGGDTDHVSDTGVDPDHVWAGANSRDPIAMLGNHGAVHLETLGGGGLGDDPTEDDFGGQRFQAEDPSRGPLPSFGQHSLYFEHGSESLHNISQIVNGDYDQVALAEPTSDPWHSGVQDPERGREPTTTTTR